MSDFQTVFLDQLPVSDEILSAKSTSIFSALSSASLIPRLSFKRDEHFPEKSQIVIDVNSEEVNEYLFLLKHLIKSKNFRIQHAAKFLLLTRREREICNLIVNGYTGERIADQLYISYDTVKTHRKNISKKLGCKNLQELMQYRLFF